MFGVSALLLLVYGLVVCASLEVGLLGYDYVVDVLLTCVVDSSDEGHL